MKRHFLFSMLLAAWAAPCLSQVAISDEDLQNQLRSMETGPVDFSPKDYYMAFHDNGLGRDSYSVYHWTYPNPIKYPLGKLELDLDRSKARPLVEYYRAPRAAFDVLNAEYSKKELEEINEQLETETADALERQFDLVYSKYKDEFSNLQVNIGKNLEFCLTTSQGMMSDHVTSLSNLNEWLCEQVEYVHRDLTKGVGNEMTQAKREAEYIRLEKQMTQLEKASYRLARRAYLLYGKKDGSGME